MSVRCIIKEKNRILLCYSRENSCYFLPGGGVNHQEELTTAIYRELGEELGLRPEQVEIGPLLCLMEVMYKDQHGLDPIFEVSLTPNIEIRSIEEHLEFHWVDLSEVVAIDLRPAILKGWIAEGCRTNHIVSKFE